MTRRRAAPRVSDDAITRFIVRRHGRKAIRDVDLAVLFGVTLQCLYQSIGSTLWLFSRSFMFQLPRSEQPHRGEPLPASLAFTKAGIIAIAALLSDEHARATGINIAHALKQRKRSSATRKRVRRRSGIDPRSPAYERAVERLQSELKKLLEA